MSKSSDGTVLSELVINSVEWSDAGRYTCFAKDALTNSRPVTQNVNLQVFGKLINAASRSVVKKSILMARGKLIIV